MTISPPERETKVKVTVDTNPVQPREPSPSKPAK